MIKYIILLIVLIIIIYIILSKRKNKNAYKEELEYVVKSLINNTNIMRIVDISTYDVEVAKNYSSYEEFINSIFNDIVIALLNYIKNNKNISEVLRKYATLDNIKDITDFILKEYGYYDTLKMIYNETKINISELEEEIKEDNIEPEPIDNLVKELSDDNGEVDLLKDIDDIYNFDIE